MPLVDGVLDAQGFFLGFHGLYKITEVSQVHDGRDARLPSFVPLLQLNHQAHQDRSENLHRKHAIEITESPAIGPPSSFHSST